MLLGIIVFLLFILAVSVGQRKFNQAKVAKILDLGSRVMSAYKTQPQQVPAKSAPTEWAKVEWPGEVAQIKLPGTKAYCNLAFYPGSVKRVLCVPDGKHASNVVRHDRVAMAPILINGAHLQRSRVIAQTEQDCLNLLGEMGIVAKATKRTKAFVPVLLPMAAAPISSSVAEFAPAPASAKADEVRLPKVLATYAGILLEHGKGKQPSRNEGEKPFFCYYADIDTENGPSRALGVDIARAIESAGAEMGDYVELKKHGKTSVIVPAVKNKAGEIIEPEKTAFKNLFSCEVVRKLQNAA